MARTAILTPSSGTVKRPKPRGRRSCLSPGRTLAYVKQNELFSSPVYNNGAAITNYVVPQFEAFFTNKAGDSIFSTMQAQVKTLLSQQG